MREIRKISKIIIIMLIFILLTGCSTNKIKLDKLEFKDTTGNRLGVDFGMMFLEFTTKAIDWYNIYVDYPLKEKEDKELEVILSNLTDISLEMILHKDGTTNEFASQVASECLKVLVPISSRQNADLELKEEKEIREVNLKKLSDKKFEEIEESRESDVEEIKELLEKMIKDHYK